MLSPMPVVVVISVVDRYGSVYCRIVVVLVRVEICDFHIASGVVLVRYNYCVVSVVKVKHFRILRVGERERVVHVYLAVVFPMILMVRVVNCVTGSNGLL